MYGRMFSLYADDSTTTPRIMRYQHQSLAMALLVLTTYIRSAPNVGSRLAFISTIHLEEPRSTASAGALCRHCSLMGFTILPGGVALVSVN
jgi:hypothetical protein